jgi:ribonuclease J
MKLIVHRGTEEIGGTCIEVATDRTRILLDVGLPLPPLDGDGPIAKLPASLGNEDRQRPDALFLSHAHGDHSGLIPALPSEIPIYLSRISSKILMAGECFAGGKVSLNDRKAITLKEWNPVTCGDIKVTPIPVDHSVPGAMAFLVESDSRRILYSGDLRWHGPRPEMMDRLISHLRTSPLDALLMEGTSLGAEQRESITEADVTERIAGRLRSSSRLALAMFSPQNVDRLHTMIEAAAQSQRSLVLDPYSLFVLHLMKSELGMPDPFEGASTLRVWFPRGRGKERTGPFKRVWDEVSALEITEEEMLATPGNFVLTFRTWMASDYPEILPCSDLAIWSYWPGYERTRRVAALRDQLQRAGIEWMRSHASGHILPSDSQRLVNELNPGTLIPIHTEQADRFPEFFPGRIVTRLRDGEIFSI